MTILQAIEEANVAANVRSFHFSDLRSTETFWASAGGEEEVPTHVLIPFNQDWVFKNGRIECTAQLEGWFLTHINQDINDYTKKEIESEYLEPMRRMCRSFFNSLLANGLVINPEVEDIRVVVVPEYQFISHGSLFGVSYRCSVPFMQGLC